VRAGYGLESSASIRQAEAKVMVGGLTDSQVYARLQEAKGSMSIEERAELKRRLLEIRSKLWQQMQDESDTEELVETRQGMDSESRNPKRKRTSMASNDNPFSATKRQNFGTQRFSFTSPAKAASISAETNSAPYSSFSRRGATPEKIFKQPGNSMGSSPAFRVSLPRKTQTPERSQTHSVVAQKVLQTLNKMSTPLDEVRKRRPPSWAVPSLVNSSRSPTISRMALTPTPLQREPPLPRNSLDVARKVGTFANDKPISILSNDGNRRGSGGKFISPFTGARSENSSPNDHIKKSGFNSMKALPEAKLFENEGVGMRKRPSGSNPASSEPTQLQKPRIAPTSPKAEPQQVNMSGAFGTRSRNNEQVNPRFVFTPPHGVVDGSCLSEAELKALSSTFDFDGPALSSTLSSTTGPVLASPAPETSNSFAHLALRADQWKCGTCSVKNKLEWDKCASCEEPRPASVGSSSKGTDETQASTVESNPSTSETLGFGASFALRADQWKCPVCSVKNKLEWDKCASCEEPRPANVGAAKEPVSTPEAKTASTSESDGKKKVQFSFASSDSSTSSTSTTAAGFDFASKPSGSFSFGVASESQQKEKEKAVSTPFTFGKSKDESSSGSSTSLFSAPKAGEDTSSPAPSGLNFGSSSSTAPSSTTTGLFGNKSSDSSEGKEAEKATASSLSLVLPEPKEKKPFTFGAPQESSLFGQKSATDESEKQNENSGFTFGATTSSSSGGDSGTSLTVSTGGAGLFGGTKPNPAETSPGGLKFGSTSSKTTTEAPKPSEEASSNGFTFGASTTTATTDASKPSEEASSGGFTFGSSSTSTTAEAPKPSEGASSSGFTFGASSTSEASKPTEGSSGGFTFGGSSSTKTETPSDKPVSTVSNPFSSDSGSASANTLKVATGGGFSFGAAKAEPASTANVTPTSGDASNGFSFGASTNTGSAAAGSSTATTSFNTPAPAGFSFGASSASNTANPTSSSAGFTFGSGPTTAAPSVTGGVNPFGSSATTGGASTPPSGGFAFGNSSSNAASVGTGTGAFGNGSQQSSSNNGFQFGAASQSASSGGGVFGGSSAPGNAAAPFGSTQQQQQQPAAGNPFGATTSTPSFGGSAQPAAFGGQHGGFGMNSNNNNNNNNNAVNSFGNSGGMSQQQQQPQNAFGGFGGQNNANSFGNAPAFGAPMPSNTANFGGMPQQSSFSAGQGSVGGQQQQGSGFNLGAGGATRTIRKARRPRRK